MPFSRSAAAPKAPCACRRLPASQMPEAPAVRLTAVGAGEEKVRQGCMANQACGVVEGGGLVGRPTLRGVT